MTARDSERLGPPERSLVTSRSAGVPSFPPSGRRLGGALSVEEASAKLTCAFHLHHELMRAIAGKLIGVAELEIKIELSHHLFQHAEAAQALWIRLHELRVPRARLEAGVPEHVQVIARELLEAESTAELVAGLHLVLGPRLAAFERAYDLETDGLVDLPTRRILRRVLADLEDMAEWGKGVIDAFVRAGESREALDGWCRHLDHVMDWLGGVEGVPRRTPSELAGLRSEGKGRFRRSVRWTRDPRFTTFQHTRNYVEGENAGSLSPRARFERDRLEVIRVQRDELDAVETFANVLHDMEDAPFELRMALARFVWDEARHAEAGQQRLEQLGYKPFDVPCGTIGIAVRSPLPPLLAFAQISTFGEVNQVGRLKSVSIAAYLAGDAATGRAIDFIHADEMLHVREGRRWLKHLVDRSGATLAELEEEARKRAIQRLHEEGILNEDYGLDLTARELSEMLGE